MKKEVAIVILNYNGKVFLEKFLPSILKTAYENFRVIIGDNASTDNSIEFLKTNYPEIEVISNKENFGFAGGYNKILERVKSDYFVLLNSDVEVQPNWINPIIALMEADPSIGACQPKILSQKQKEYFEYAGAAGGYLDKYGYPFCRGRLFDSVELDTGQYNKNKEVFWASGAALFVRAKVYADYGGLDSDFFAHMEEIDFCWRLKNAGYKILYCSESVVYHVGGGTLDVINPKKTFLNFRNSLICIQKNLRGNKVLWVFWVRIWLDLLAWLKFVLEGKMDHALAINKAHFHFFFYQFKWIKKRKKLKKLIDLKKINTIGWYNRSIVWDYFLLKRKKFSDLKLEKIEN